MSIEPGIWLHVDILERNPWLVRGLDQDSSGATSVVLDRITEGITLLDIHRVRTVSWEASEDRVKDYLGDFDPAEAKEWLRG